MLDEEEEDGREAALVENIEGGETDQPDEDEEEEKVEDVEAEAVERALNETASPHWLVGVMSSLVNLPLRRPARDNSLGTGASAVPDIAAIISRDDETDVASNRSVSSTVTRRSLPALELELENEDEREPGFVAREEGGGSERRSDCS